MRRHDFVLSVPRAWSGPSKLSCVDTPAIVIADRPTLWRDPAADEIDLGAHGVLIGTVFRHGRPASSSELRSAWPAGATPEQVAHRLVEEFWGAYCAILIDPSGLGLSLVTDPSGLFPVYRTVTDRHLVLGSNPRLLAIAGATAPAVSWPDLRAHLVRPELRQRATCLVGIDELSPGALTAVTGLAEPVPIWRPDRFMPLGKTPRFDEAAEQLRTCARETIGAWASRAGPVAVAASGGVDSSLICAALADGGHDFCCVTLATADPSCDERAFVRELAEHLEVRWQAATYDAADIDLTRAASAGLPRPARRTFMQALDAALDRGRQELGASAIFDGNGGDNLFCFLHSSVPVLDALRAAGPRTALGALADMCGVTGCDLPTMMAAIARRAVRGQQRSGWAPDARLLSRVEPAPAVDPLTPWFDTAVGRHAGKRDHLDLIIHAQNRLHGLGGLAVPRFSPLLSQPMVELCLSLPTWLWSHGGINRAVARAAFADRLPVAIRRRTSKAGPDSFIRRLFASSRHAIRELLMDGRLARHDIIDRPAVEMALETDALSGDAIIYRLLDLVEAEAWAQSWHR